MTTSSRESAIQARLDAATPGPWVIEEGGDWPGVVTVEGNCIVADWGAWLEAPECIADAELIANAPADLAFLLAENAALRARIDNALALAHKPGAGKEHVLAALTDEGTE